jgi:hypothetical protein
MEYALKHKNLAGSSGMALIPGSRASAVKPHGCARGRNKLQSSRLAAIQMFAGAQAISTPHAQVHEHRHSIGAA